MKTGQRVILAGVFVLTFCLVERPDYRGAWLNFTPADFGNPNPYAITVAAAVMAIGWGLFAIRNK
ncbi:MAG: hypothetical protein ABWY78_06435 [Microvirga sp.]